MLPENKDSFCFRCHGHSQTVSRAKQNGDVSGDFNDVNLQREFDKTYHHPVEKVERYRYRGASKILPEMDPSAPRTVSCVDCHHHHYVTKENKLSGIRGVNVQGAQVDSIRNIYELCFKCHSFSANLPADQSNKAELFRVTNPSYHPVIAAGKNDYVPSLMQPLRTQSIIKCIDCHNTDSPTGPRGPHGSQYRYLLSKHYSATDGSESNFQYELCYSCHNRSSILRNDSFQFHNQHISTTGTSCRTCHNPHGSTHYSHLIDFGNNPSITPSSNGNLEFRDLGTKKGECFLNCHGKDHNPAAYPNTTSSPQVNPSRQRKR